MEETPLNWVALNCDTSVNGDEEASWVAAVSDSGQKSSNHTW